MLVHILLAQFYTDLLNKQILVLQVYYITKIDLNFFSSFFTSLT